MWEQTLQVLEHKLPGVFAGISKMYRGKKKVTYPSPCVDDHYNVQHVNRSNHRPKVAQEIKDLIARNMSREVQFYQFCKDRLLKQLEEIGKGEP